MEIGRVVRAGPVAAAIAITLVFGALPAAGASDPVLVGAGDIASCASSGDSATARLLDAIPGTVFTAGDNAYQSGTAAEYANCYGPTWGRHRSRTRPVPGNHEYGTAGAAGYFDYFGWRAGSRSRGYYSYDLGAWHIVALNSNCAAVGGCARGSPQERWLRADLAAHPRACTLAYWHHPRFSSGQHGGTTAVQAFWQALYDYRADIIVSGHDHDYERFGPQNAAGVLDYTRGIRLFVVGTGGKSLYAFRSVQPNSRVRSRSTYGVLKLTLHARTVDYRFAPVAGGTFTDAGTLGCK